MRHGSYKGARASRSGECSGASSSPPSRGRERWWGVRATTSLLDERGVAGRLRQPPAPGARGDAAAPPPPQSPGRGSAADAELGFAERALSAAGAAFLSAIIVNPLDVAKTRLQAQAAGVPYYHLRSINVDEWRPRAERNAFRFQMFPNMYSQCNIWDRTSLPPDCFQYKGTLDEGFARLWRGTNAGLALAIPTVGIYLPCYDIFRNWIEDFTTCNAPSLNTICSTSCRFSCTLISMHSLFSDRAGKDTHAVSNWSEGPWNVENITCVLSPLKNTSQTIQNYRILWTGVGAQLARDVPFSAICWGTLEPTRRKLLALVDVAKTRRQIEKDPEKAMKMTTRQTLLDIWRSGGVKGLFTGVGPRVGRAGPSVGIVVSFYEVVKYVLHQRNTS
uniref:Mitochondrial carrier protein MTM1 n=1 Tax=Ananas comosus var. bracteatus TaxID=296719 RepID=A0A6V7QVP3_ANACO